MEFTKTNLKEMKKEFGITKVEKRVINDLLAENYTTQELVKHIKDVADYGCASGCVSSMVYYKDTTRFFNCYRAEIIEMIEEHANSLGIWEYDEKDNMYIKIGGEKYYEGQKRFSDDLKNNLAWFIYEEVCAEILNHFELYN